MWYFETMSSANIPEYVENKTNTSKALNSNTDFVLVYPYLLEPLNPDPDTGSSSGGITTVYWNAICIIGSSEVCLQQHCKTHCRTYFRIQSNGETSLHQYKIKTLKFVSTQTWIVQQKFQIIYHHTKHYFEKPLKTSIQERTNTRIRLTELLGNNVLWCISRTSKQTHQLCLVLLG